MSSAPHVHGPRPWRGEPHRVLFPLGAALAISAVLPFACRGGGGGAVALFHSVAQIQGFLTCFAVGLLLTFVPRLTRTAPASRGEVLAALALPALAVLAAWGGDAAVASWIWLALLGMVLAFTLTRLRARPGAVRAAPVLVWVPASIAAGAVGAVLVGGGPALPAGWALPAWTVGRGLLVQGFVTGLVLGVGGFLLPRVARGEPPSAREGDATRRRGVGLHAAAAALFFGSFPLELATSPPVGFGVRAAVSAAVLVGTARLHRPPVVRGLLHRLVLLAAWLVPVAFLFGALAPRFRGAALHVLFVGGFAQLALAVSTDVVLRREDLPRGEGRGAMGIAAMAAFLAAAFAARIAATIDVRHVAGWLEAAAYAFCAAIAAWATAVAPGLVAGRAAGAGDPAPRDP